MDPYSIINKYYTEGSTLRAILVRHSEAVRDLALRMLDRHPELGMDRGFVAEAAMLHDIGIYLTDADGICCHGTHQYIEHGYLGADLVRREGYGRHALVCERHTGTGLSLDYIIRRGLPLPHRDMRPVSLEEKLICYADKFYSKTHLDTAYPIGTVRAKLQKWGDTSVETFDQWTELFG